MKRRTVAIIIVTLALGVLAAPVAVEAQQPGKLSRIGILRATSSVTDTEIAAFKQALHDLGQVEGRNIVVEQPRAKSYDDLPRVAAELARLKVDAILAASTPATRAARDTITTIPVVFVTFSDPVRTGLVTSLARPNRNMTGVTMLARELAGKRLELLRELLPTVMHVAVLWNPANRDTEEQLNETRAAAQSLGIGLAVHPARSPADLADAVGAIAAERTDALFLLSDTMFFVERRRIAGLAEKARLPAMYHWRAYVEAGGLMSYGPNLTELYRRAAYFVDRILKGATPADLPVEQPTKFELIINMKTAKTLGITVPPSVLARADEVIQ